jgi:hypothetical protein
MVRKPVTKVNDESRKPAFQTNTEIKEVTPVNTPVNEFVPVKMDTRNLDLPTFLRIHLDEK